MSEKTSTTVTYTPLESGDGESRWIRLEQVQATLPGPGLGDVAEMVDRLYDIEPCDDGMGGGGEEADEANEPSAEAVEEELSIVLEREGQCRQGYWLAAVNVYRTHRQPGYELRSETARVQTVRQVTESYSQVVDVDGPLIALERPYAGGLSGIPRDVKWEVRGATVNLDRPVHDHLILRYNTWHEYVTLRVPTKQTGDGEEYEPAAVVAFWGDMAAECQLDPPEPEDEEDRQAKLDLCNRNRPRPEREPVGCWKTIGHYSMCECSKRRVNEWEEQTEAPCDGFPAGAYVGHEEHFDGYVGGDGCDGYEPELRTPEFYKKHCCKPLTFSTSRLPECRRYYAQYRGGHEIENGPDHWRNIYGDNVIMRAVLPESGICGEQITEWDVPNKNCCDDAVPLTPSPNNPESIEPGHQYRIGVEGGAPEWASQEMTWQASGGLEFVENGETTLKTPNGVKFVYVRARPNICPNPSVLVKDGCSEVEMIFVGDEGEGPSLPSFDRVVPENTEFSMSANGGVPPYMWMASGGVSIIGWSPDGSSAYFRTAKAPEYCAGEVTVVDQCGRSDSCAIRNGTRGKWVDVPEGEFDPCNPPGAPYDFVFNNWSPGGGYRVMLGRYSRYNIGACSPLPEQCNCGTNLGIAPGFAQAQAKSCRGEWREQDGCCWYGDSSSNIVYCLVVVAVQKWVCG